MPGTMWLVLTIVLVFLLLLIGFLVVPFIVYVNTDEHRYEVGQFPGFKLSIDHTTLRPQLTLLGFHLPLSGEKRDKEAKSIEKKPASPEKKQSIFQKSFKAWRFLVLEILSSFRIKRFVLLLDTDDVVLNAKLTPLCMLATRGPYLIQTNYTGRMYCALEVTNTPGRLLWIFLQFLIKK